jgi:hypothetical protein
MRDIVEKLRSAPVDNRPATLLNDAADEILRLGAENEKLRKVLIEIQWKTQDVIRPVPFQEDDDEN